MTFDESKVYTALNADELRVGSRCIFADTIQDLKKTVKRSAGYERTKLRRLQDDTNTCRFIDSFGKMFVFAYLIESPKESEYRPFESIEEAMKAIKAHGGWVRDTTGNRCYAIVAYDADTVETKQDTFGVDALLDCFVFVDDGSPCGVPVWE